mgnify:CR=1 FL=1
MAYQNLKIGKYSLFFGNCGGPEKGRLLLKEGGKKDLSLGLLGLLGEEDGLNVGQDTSLGDGDTGEQFVQLLVVPDC